MAKYTLDEAQREIVETALIIYEDSLAKLWKKSVANRVDTADIDDKLAVIRGDDERAGLLRIFAKDLPEQKDAFHDAGEDEDLDETLDGIEEEAAERIKAQEDEAPDHELVEEIEPAPSNEGEKQEHPPEAAIEEEPEEAAHPDLPLEDLDLPYMRAFVDAVPAGLAPDAPREAIEAALIAQWSKASPVEGPSGPERAPIGGWWHQHPSGRLVPCRVDPTTLSYWYGGFATGATPSLAGDDAVDAALLVLHARSVGALAGTAGTEAEDEAGDPFADDPENPFAEAEGKAEEEEEEEEGEEHDGVRRAHSTYSRAALEAMKARELKQIAGDLGLEVEGTGKQGRVLIPDLVAAIYAHQHPEEPAEAPEPEPEPEPKAEQRPLPDFPADRPTMRELEKIHAEAARRMKPEPEPALALVTDNEPEEEGGLPSYLADVPVVERACLDCLDYYGPDGVCTGCGDVATWGSAAK